VARSAYDLALAQLNAQRQASQESDVRWVAESNHARESYDALLTRYHQLKLQGYTEPVPTPTPLPVQPDDPIEKAINVASRGMGPIVRDGMFRQAAIDEAMGVKKEDIAQRILLGTRPMDEALTFSPSNG